MEDTRRSHSLRWSSQVQVRHRSPTLSWRVVPHIKTTLRHRMRRFGRRSRPCVLTYQMPTRWNSQLTYRKRRMGSGSRNGVYPMHPAALLHTCCRETLKLCGFCLACKLVWQWRRSDLTMRCTRRGWLSGFSNTFRHGDGFWSFEIVFPLVRHAAELWSFAGREEKMTPCLGWQRDRDGLSQRG